MSFELPSYLSHYYRERPFRTLTELAPDELAPVLETLALSRKLPRRLKSDFYFDERRKFERTMRDQFIVKGGEPVRDRPHFAILGESEIRAHIEPRMLRVPLASIPSRWISFTYTDSWAVYVDRDLRGNPLARKPQYGMVYRLEELPSLFETYGWPGDR